MSSSIDFNKPVQTRLGQPVTIVITNGRGARPMAGYIGNATVLQYWYSDGTAHGAQVLSTYDLCNVPDPFAELKAAHAKGETIQFMLIDGTGIWHDTRFPAWSALYAYRIKPSITQSCIVYAPINAEIRTTMDKHITLMLPSSIVSGRRSTSPYCLNNLQVVGYPNYTEVSLTVRCEHA